MKLFGIFASILGFVVDAVTILGWFLNPDTFVLRNFKVPVINVPFPMETLTLVILIYTFVLFLLLRYSPSYYDEQGKNIYTTDEYRKQIAYTIVSAATLPFFFIWAGTFYNLDKSLIVVLSFLSIDLYCFIVFSTVNYAYSFLAGLLFSPLASAWLHEQYGYGWLKSFGLGILLGNSGLLLIMAFFLIPLTIIGSFNLVSRLWTTKSPRWKRNWSRRE